MQQVAAGSGPDLPKGYLDYAFGGVYGFDMAFGV
jgi:hypothetical protein